MAKVTVLGLGAMGSRMALSLLHAGHDVTVWNRSPEKIALLMAAGAVSAVSPREAVRGAEFAIAMVRDDEASGDVWLDEETGALAGMPTDAIAIESSTLTAAWIAALSARFRDGGIALLDAPVAGSRPQADARQLIYFVGGDERAFSKAEPILKAIGAAVHHVGQSGNGAIIKLAVNGLFGIQLAALGELIGFLDKSGLDVSAAIEILGATPVLSPAAKGAAASMLAQNFTPLFPVDLIEKDFGYLQATASAFEAELPLCDQTRRVFQDAASKGHRDENATSVVRLYR